MEHSLLTNEKSISGVELGLIVLTSLIGAAILLGVAMAYKNLSLGERSTANESSNLAT